MDIRKILSIILTRYNNENKVSIKILNEIQESIMEMEAAEAMFNNVNDSKLIEAAIYRQEAAKKRFDYLLSIAKDEVSKKESETRKEMEI
ncbi:MAG: DUF2508 family protein [Clostridium sp.]|jgi:hypothetical protein|nr:DUF2508 family protein [Clostridium sp.]